MSYSLFYIIDNLDVGGAERHLVQVLPGLARRGFRVTLLTLTHEGKLAPLLREAGTEIISPPGVSSWGKLPSFLRKPLSLALFTGKLWWMLRRRRPDVLHFFLPAAYLAGGLASLPFHGPVRIMSRRSLNYYQKKHPLAARMERWLHPHMNAVLANSLAVADDLRKEGVGEQKLGLLYNGVDLEHFASLPPREEVRARLGLSPSALLIVCVANLIPYKGHEDLLLALAQIRTRMPPDWRIAFVGRNSGNCAPFAEKLQQMALDKELGPHILWLGERKDVSALYGCCDLGVLASHEEGFSNSILEGMAAGVPMVVTDVGGNSEAVVDGKSGFVVPPHHPEELGNAILKLASDVALRNRMATCGRLRVEQRFSLDHCIGCYQQLYHHLLSDQAALPVQAMIDHPARLPQRTEHKREQER